MPVTSNLRSLQLVEVARTGPGIANGGSYCWYRRDIVPLLKLSQLSSVSFSGKGSGDSEIEAQVWDNLKKLTSMQCLDISTFSITDAMLQHFAYCSRLTALTISTHGLSALVADRLRTFGALVPVGPHYAHTFSLSDGMSSAFFCCCAAVLVKRGDNGATYREHCISRAAVAKCVIKSY